MFNDLEQINLSAASQIELTAKRKQFMRSKDYLKWLNGFDGRKFKKKTELTGDVFP